MKKEVRDQIKEFIEYNIELRRLSLESLLLYKSIIQERKNT